MILLDLKALKGRMFSRLSSSDDDFEIAILNYQSLKTKVHFLIWDAEKTGKDFLKNVILKLNLMFNVTNNAIVI